MVSSAFALATVLAAADPLMEAKRALSEGDPITAFTVVSAAAVAESDRVDGARQADINLLAAAMAGAALPTRELQWRAAVDARRGAESGWEQPALDRDRYDPARLGRALPTVPPDAPAVAGKDAWVNVASAAVRQTASEKGKLLVRLPIGLKVRAVQQAGSFVRVSFQRAETKVKAGFIHKDLLSAKPPAVDDLLEKGKQDRGEIGLVMLWRALNLDPTRKDSLDAVLDASFALARFDVALDAVRVAISASRWPLIGESANATAEALRLTLYRAAVARKPSAIVHLMPELQVWEQLAREGGCVGAGWPRLPADPGAELWPQLQGLLLSPLERTSNLWAFEADGRWLLLGETGGGGSWKVRAIDAGGVRAPNDNQCQSRAAVLEPFIGRKRGSPPPAPAVTPLLVAHYSDKAVMVRLDMPEVDDSGARAGVEQALVMPRTGKLAECFSHHPRRTRAVVELKVTGSGAVAFSDACTARALEGLTLPATGNAYGVRVTVSVL